MLHTMMGRTACRLALGWPLSLQVLSTTCLCCKCFFTKTVPAPLLLPKSADLRRKTVNYQPGIVG